MADPAYKTRFASGFLDGMWAGRGYNWQSNTPTWENEPGFTSGKALQVVGLANGTQVPATTQGGAVANPDGVQRIEVEPNITALPASVKGTGADAALIYPGATGYFGLAFTLGAGFPTNPRSGSGGLAWQVISQFKNEGGGSPPFELSIGDDMLYLDGNNGGWRINVAPVAAGQTYRVVMGLTFTEAAATSVVSVWVNGELVVNAQTPAGKGATPSGFLYPGLAGYWKLGLYRRANMPTVAEAQVRYAAVAADASRQNVQEYLDGSVVAVGGGGGGTAPVGVDAYQTAVLSELASWKAWLNANGAKGHVGEFGGVTLMAYYDKAGEQALWDALATKYLAAVDYHQLWSTVWAAGREWGIGYPLGLIVGAAQGDNLTVAHAGAQPYLAHPSSGSLRHGMNLAGWENGITIAGGGTVRSGPGYPHTAADFQVLDTYGVDTIRLPLAWERMQPTLGGALDPAALQLLEDQLLAANAAGIGIILDLHNYGRFTNANGTVSALGGTLTNAQLTDFWTKLSTWVRASTGRNQAVIAYDVMNEPNALVGGAVTWETASQAVVTALRQAGDNRVLLIEGYTFSGLVEWSTWHPDGWITDPANNFRYSAHHYWDTKSALGSRSGTYQQSATGPILTYEIERAARAGEVPTDPNPQPTGPQPPAFQALTEDWSNGLRRDPGQAWANSWDGANGVPSLAVVNGRLTVTSSAGPNYASAQTRDVWRLSGSQVRLEVPKVQAVTAGSTGTVQTAVIINSATSAAGTRLVIAHRADLGQIQFRVEVGYADAGQVNLTYNATTHRWWGMRHDGTNIIFETSADGLTWVTRRTVAAPAWTATPDQRLTLEAWRDNGATDTAQFDNVNMAGATYAGAAALIAQAMLGVVADVARAGAAVLGVNAAVDVSTPTAVALPTATLAARGQLSAGAVRTTTAEVMTLAARGQLSSSYTTRTDAGAQVLAARSSMAPVSPGQLAVAPLAARAGLVADGLASKVGVAPLVATAEVYGGASVLPALGAGLNTRASVTVTAQQTHTGTGAALAARGQVTAGPTVAAAAVAGLAARAQLDAAPFQTGVGGAALAVRASLDPGGYAAKRAAVAMAARGVFVGAGDGRIPGLVSMAARAALAGDPRQTAVAAATMRTSAQLIIGALASARMAARASLAASGTPGRVSAVAMAVRASVVADGRRANPAGATLAASAAIGGDWVLVKFFDPVTLAARGEFQPTVPTVWTPIFRAPVPREPQTRAPRTRLLVANTVSGRIAWELPFDQLRWNSPLNKIGSCTATLPIEDTLDAINEQGANDPGAALYDSLSGRMKNTLIVAYGNEVLWAGPLMSAQESEDTPAINIGAAGPERFLEKRIVRTQWADNPYRYFSAGNAVNDLVLQDTNARDAIMKLVSNSVSGVDPLGNARNWGLVYVANRPDATGNETFRWTGYDLTTVWKAISDLTSRIDGPDIRFDPFLQASGMFLSYTVQIGDPFLTGRNPVGPNGPVPWTWDDATSRVSRDSDSVGLATQVFVPGNGQERAKSIAVAWNNKLPQLGWPVLEEVDSSQGSVEDDQKLLAFAKAKVAAQALTDETWRAKVPIDGDPAGGQFRVGDAARFDLKKHVLIPRGVYDRRITELAGDGGPYIDMVLDSESDLQTERAKDG